MPRFNAHYRRPAVPRDDVELQKQALLNLMNKSKLPGNSARRILESVWEQHGLKGFAVDSLRPEALLVWQADETSFVPLRKYLGFLNHREQRGLVVRRV